jgi:hypothetical protein
MTSRTFKLAAGAFALAGTGLMYVFLTASLQPHKKPPKLTSVNVQTLRAGQHIALDTESLRYFVVKTTDSELHVVAIPMDQGTVVLPDVHWWKPFMNCKDFGLDSIGGVTAQSRFRCRDADQPTEWVNRWQWDVHGKHIADTGAKIDNMYRVRFERSASEVVFTGLEPD